VEGKGESKLFVNLSTSHISLVSLTFCGNTYQSVEILSALEVRNYTGADQGKTKFPQQKVKVVTNYPELLEDLGIDAVIHGNAILSAD